MKDYNEEEGKKLLEGMVCMTEMVDPFVQKWMNDDNDRDSIIHHCHEVISNYEHISNWFYIHNHKLAQHLIHSGEPIVVDINKNVFWGRRSVGLAIYMEVVIQKYLAKQ